jgi:YidC/Oxa1 family membrane protein insertase
MEKRTFVYLLSVLAVYAVITLFFNYQNRENLKNWEIQQAAIKEQKIQRLDAEIAQRTAKPDDLPLMEIYADSEGMQPLTFAIKDQNSLLTFKWQEELPQKVFAKPMKSTESLKEYYLMKGLRNDFSIYHRGVSEKLKIADLPDFGKFDLQLISLYPLDSATPIAITIADYTDGNLSVPYEMREKLKKQMDEETDRPLSKSVVLLKSSEGYLPVGLYFPETQTLSLLKNIEELAETIKLPEPPETEVTPQLSEERFYVLENAYQQLVFSNYGGALVEINLPFASESNPYSVVKEIEFDREMVQKHPYNARFPAHPFYTAGKNAEGPYNEHVTGKLGGYYPLLRRDLIQGPRRKSERVAPRYYALNIVSEYPEVAELVYEVKHFDDKKIVFETVQNHRRITKTYSITEEDGAPYCINLTVQIEGDSRGLWLTSGIPEVEWISGSPAPALIYRMTRNQKADVQNIELPKGALTNTSIYPDWICSSNGFLGMIMNPISPIDPGYRAQQVPGTVVPSRLVEIDQDYDRFKAQDMPGYMTLLPLNSKGGIMNFHVFAGPFSDDILLAVDKYYSDPATGYNPDFIACQTFHGWFAFISEPFANFLFVLMKFFHYITGSWAFSIILLTIALRLMLYPLNAWSTKSMLKMQQIAPEVTAIQEKYKKDPKQAQLKVMELYREKGVNPMSGCLPLLIQMPFLIGMFDLLKSTFELRGASFIPGWIDNLAAPDVLFSWTTPIFFIGNQFHLLPILLGLVMFFQQRMMSTLPKDQTLWTEQQRQQRAMGTMMTVMFTILFYNFPSGLNIYWLSSMLLGMLQQWWTQKRMALGRVINR